MGHRRQRCALALHRRNPVSIFLYGKIPGIMGRSHENKPKGGREREQYSPRFFRCPPAYYFHKLPAMGEVFREYRGRPHERAYRMKDLRDKTDGGNKENIGSLSPRVAYVFHYRYPEASYRKRCMIAGKPLRDNCSPRYGMAFFSRSKNRCTHSGVV